VLPQADSVEQRFLEEDTSNGNVKKRQQMGNAVNPSFSGEHAVTEKLGKIRTKTHIKKINTKYRLSCPGRLP
jgi:hypothetical protein